MTSERGKFGTNLNVCIDIFSDAVYRSHSRYNDTCIFQFYKSLILHVERICMHDRCHASCEEHSGKCYDERLDVKVCYQKSLYQSEC